MQVSISLDLEMSKTLFEQVELKIHYAISLNYYKQIIPFCFLLLWWLAEASLKCCRKFSILDLDR